MSKTIDLGRSFREEMGNITPASPDAKHYPELHIPDSDDDRLLDLPDQGSAEIKFKVVRRHHREETNGDKKKRRTCSITLEILSIEAPEKQAKKTHWEMFNGK
jgi:hypothetical protein